METTDEQIEISTDLIVESWLKNGVPICSEIKDQIKLEGRRSYKTRHKYVSKYSMSIPCYEALYMISNYQPLVEIGCGNGFWARLLQDMGVDIIPTNAKTEEINGTPYPLENTKPFTEIELIDGVEAVKKYKDRNVFCSWPSLGEDWAYRALVEMNPKSSFIYLGEEWASCAVDSMFQYLDSYFYRHDEAPIARYDGIHDYLTVFRAKETEVEHLPEMIMLDYENET